MRDALQGKQPQHMTDLALVANSFEWRVLAQWLACKTQKGEVPISSHDKGKFFQCLHMANQPRLMTGVQG